MLETVFDKRHHHQRCYGLVSAVDVVGEGQCLVVSHAQTLEFNKLVEMCNLFPDTHFLLATTVGEITHQVGQMGHSL